MKIMVINGPNLNMLGIREPQIYGEGSYKQLAEMLEDHAKKQDIELCCRQSNHEGVLIDWIQEAFFAGYDGIVLNPGGYTHTSVALLDALLAVKLPAVEVHISDVDAREDFRKISYVSGACIATIKGKGFDGYIEAIELLKDYLHK